MRPIKPEELNEEGDQATWCQYGSHALSLGGRLDQSLVLAPEVPVVHDHQPRCPQEVRRGYRTERNVFLAQVQHMNRHESKGATTAEEKRTVHKRY